MSEEIKALVRRWYDTHQPGRVAEAEAMCSEDFRGHMAGMPEPIDRNQFKQMAAMFFTAFSEIEQTVDDQLAEGDKVASRGNWRARHTGEFQGILATDRLVTMRWMGVDRIADSKIAEHWAYLDMLSVLRQIGPMAGAEASAA